MASLTIQALPSRDARPVRGVSVTRRLRLTPRGVLLIRLGVALLVVVVLGLGILANRPAVAGEDSLPVVTAYRVVLPGETLWAIAGEVAPTVDRRETIALLLELNGLEEGQVRSGQRLRVPAGSPGQR